jgi:hypothetical protein
MTESKYFTEPLDRSLPSIEEIKAELSRDLEGDRIDDSSYVKKVDFFNMRCLSLKSSLDR